MLTRLELCERRLQRAIQIVRKGRDIRVNIIKTRNMPGKGGLAPWICQCLQCCRVTAKKSCRVFLRDVMMRVCVSLYMIATVHYHVAAPFRLLTPWLAAK